MDVTNETDALRRVIECYNKLREEDDAAGPQKALRHLMVAWRAAGPRARAHFLDWIGAVRAEDIPNLYNEFEANP